MVVELSSGLRSGDISYDGLTCRHLVDTRVIKLR